MSNKVLQITPEDAKYLDPTQIASIQMIDGTNIIVRGQEEEGFVEEGQPDEQQYQTQDVYAQQQQPQNLRGRGRGLGALAGIAAGTALLGTAAALGGMSRRAYYGPPYYGRPMMGPMMMPPPPPRPFMRPMFW